MAIGTITPQNKRHRNKAQKRQKMREKSPTGTYQRKNAEDFINHKRTLRNDFLAPRVVGMGAKDKQS